MSRRFRITQSFWSETRRSQYVAGLTYTARTDELVADVEQWIREGRAEWVKAEAGAAAPAAVAGTATVSAPPKPRR